MSTPAGWYPDPAAPAPHATPGAAGAQLRWWDGTRWTEHVHRDTPGPSLTKAPHPGPHPGGPHDPRGAAPRPYPSPYPSQYPPSQYPVPGVKAIATPDGQALGGLGARLLARIVDWLLVSLIATAAAWSSLRTVENQVRAAMDTWSGGDPERASSLLVEASRGSASQNVTLVLLLVSAAYTILTVRFAGATPGKLLLRLRVRDWERPGLPSWGQAIVRWLGSDLLGQLFGIWYLVDFLWPCWDQRRQALHDKMGRTVVVKR